MGREYIYICDMCGKKSTSNYLNNYEIHTDYCSDTMHKVENTKTLEVCSLCASKLIEPFSIKGGEK